MRGLVALLLLAMGSGTAQAYEPAEALKRAREDFRSVAHGQDEDARQRLSRVWKSAEVKEELALRQVIVKASSAGALQRLEKASDELLKWSETHRNELQQMAAEPEKIGGRRGIANRQRLDFFTAVDEWNALLQRRKGKLKGSAAEEYTQGSAVLLRSVRTLADEGAPVTGRFLFKGFDRVAGLDSARQLHQQAHALLDAHDRGDSEAAAKVKALGWGAQGMTAATREALDAWEAYKAEAERFSKGVAGGAAVTSAKAAAAEPTTAVIPAERPPGATATAVPGAPSGSPLDATLDGLFKSISAGQVSQAPAAGLAGFVSVARGLSDPDASARRSDGGLLRQASAGTPLPPGFFGGLAMHLKKRPVAANATEIVYGRYLTAGTTQRLDALDAAIEKGQQREAIRLHSSAALVSAKEAGAQVKLQIAERRSAGRAAKVATTAPEALKLLSMLPAGAEDERDDQAFLEEAKSAGEVQRPVVQLPQVAPYLAPPPHRDGIPRGNSKAQMAHVEALAQVTAQLAESVAPISEELGKATAAVKSANADAKTAHLDLVRDGVFGPMPEACPEGQEVSPCPELLDPKAQHGRCQPVGTTCSGQAPLDLSFR